MLDYVRWIFNLDFCIPRYVIMRQVMDKFKIGWGLKARKYEEKIKSGNTDNVVRECWEEKSYDWNDRYDRNREVIR